MAGSKRKATPDRADAARVLVEATSAARKKTKNSEFVSVEAGMRALKRRLGSTTRDSNGSKDAQEKAAEAKPRATVKRSAASTVNKMRPAAKTVQSKLVLDAALSLKRSSAKPPASTESDDGSKPKATGSRTRSPAVNLDEVQPTKAPAQRAPRAATNRGKAAELDKPRKPRAPRSSTKPTLAQVRAEMLREQQDRVESRIQTLQSSSQTAPTIASMPSQPAGDYVPPAPMTNFHNAHERVEPVVHYEPPVMYAAHSPETYAVSSSSQYHMPRETIPKPLSPRSYVCHETDHTASEKQYSPLRESVPMLHGASDNIPAQATTNEFINDDFDEDMAFLHALEEVENKLATPSKFSSPADTISAKQDAVEIPPKNSADRLLTDQVQPNQRHVLPQSYFDPNRLRPTSQNSSREEPVKVDDQYSNPNSNQQGDQQSNNTQQNAVAPEVLREMERLKRENDELRRSNELWQAVALHRSTTSTPVNGDASTPIATADNDRKRLPEEDKRDDDQPVARVLDLNPSPRTLEDSSFDVMTHTSNPNSFGASNSDYDESQLYGAETSRVSASTHTFLPSEECDQEYRAQPSNVGSRGIRDVEIAESWAVVEHSQDIEQKAAEKSQCQEPVDDHRQTSAKGSQNIEFAEPSYEDASNIGEKKDDPMNENEDVGATDHERTNIGYSAEVVRSSTIDRGTDERYKRSYDDDEDDDIEDVSHQDAHKGVRSHAIANRKSRQERVFESRTVADKSDSHLKPVLVLAAQQKPNVVYQVDSDSESDDVTIIESEQEPIPSKSSSISQSQASDSSSESESEDEELSQTEGRSSSNVLEAALKAASGSKLSAKADPGASSSKQTQRVAVSKEAPPRGTHKQTIESLGKKRPRAEASAEFVPPSSSYTARKLVQSKKSTASSQARSKSSVLWPVLDEFYDLILDLSPQNIRVSEGRQQCLQRYQRKTLPGSYATKADYMNVQLEAIMEEMVAGLRNSDEMRGNSNVKSLYLTSVSPCGSASALSSSNSRLNTSAIFMESAFSGTTCNSNDFMLTFHSNMMSKNGPSIEFINGDVVELSSPRWKEHRVHVFGIVLCNSVVAVGSGSDNPNDSDQICLLIRTPESAHESFALLTEMCLANQRSSNWRWRLEQVHNMTTSAREFQAIKSVSFFNAEVAKTLQEGRLTQDATADPSRSKPTLTPALQQYLQRRYNESQMDSILGAIGQQKQVIIQGPPGTGKSKTILGILAALLDGAALNASKKTSIKVGASLHQDQSSSRSKSVVESSIRILVAAPSNAAVDELIVRLLKEGVYDSRQKTLLRPRIVRVGRPESIQQQHQSRAASDRATSETKKLRKKWRKYAKDVDSILLENLVTKLKSSFATVKLARQAILKNAQIVFCTLSGAGSAAMCEFAQEFDALVIDEAAQAVEASTLIPFKFKPSRVVLVGDHRQLPATVLSKKLVGIGYDRSLFQRLVENGSPVFLLTQQYRMHPSISRFPSKYFYDGRLVNDVKMKERTKRKYHKDRCFKPFVFFDVLDGEQSQVNGSKSLRNMTEVDFIVLLVRSLLARYPSMDWQDKIGIIAPYKQQIYELGSELHRLESQLNIRLAIEVNTVDGFQGREKEIIIYSCVRTRSSDQRSRRNGAIEAFWADERRMNVAITRAQSSLWVIGNSQLLQQSPAWRTLLEDARARDLYINETDFKPPPPME